MMQYYPWKIECALCVLFIKADAASAKQETVLVIAEDAAFSHLGKCGSILPHDELAHYNFYFQCILLCCIEPSRSVQTKAKFLNICCQ